MSDLEKYAIRIHCVASSDIDAAYQQLAVFNGASYAGDWEKGLWEAISTLATLSRRRPAAIENRLFQSDIWEHLYQFRKSRVIYRLLFEIVENDADAPFVHILHVRPAARKPMTRAEAREIEKDNA